MRPVPLLLLAFVLLALPAAAQPSDPARPEAAGDAAPRAVAFTPEHEGLQPERWSTGARLNSELGGAGLGLGVGGLAGGAALGLVGLAGCAGGGGMLGYWGCVGAVAAGGAILGGLVGMPLGIRWGGARAGGNGSAFAAFLGMSLSAIPVALMLGSEHNELTGLVALSAPLFGILGYELSDWAPSGTRVTPALALTRGGGSLGLQGHF